MKLCYRGVKYDYTPPSLEVRESDLTGCYRGHSVNFAYVRHVPVPQPVAQLTYRGVDYMTTADGQIKNPVTTAVVVPEQQLPVFQASTSSSSSLKKARRQLLQEASSSHRYNIQRSIQHRMSVAKSQGNDRLLQQLEEELHQLV